MCFHTLPNSRISGLRIVINKSEQKWPLQTDYLSTIFETLWSVISATAEDRPRAISSISISFRALMDFPIGSVMLETSGAIAGQWSIIVATAGCQSRLAVRCGLLEPVMEMDSGRCSQTHLSIIAVSIVIARPETGNSCDWDPPTNFSFLFALFFFFFRKITILIKMSYARWVADCSMEISQVGSKHSSVNKTEYSPANIHSCARTWNRVWQSSFKTLALG